MDTTVLVRTTTDAAGLKDLARREAYAVEPCASTVREHVRREDRKRTDHYVCRAHGATALGILALMLAVIGLYGVVGGPTHVRNRNSDGACSTGTQCSRSRFETGHEAGSDWRRHWYSRVTRRGATVIEYVGWVDYN